MGLDQSNSLSALMPVRCNPKDYWRAFYCAEAVLRPQNSEIEAFLNDIQKEFPFVEFGDIHVSLELNPDYRFKFLLADAADAVFIAFQVSQNFDDPIGSALCTLPSGGQVDRAAFKLSHDFLGNDLNILTELFRKGKRVVFCGLEFGGALAHMIVLQFWAPLYDSGDTVSRDQNEMISIAFGSPCVCSSAYAEQVNNSAELKSHFFAFVHEDDPRRSSLCGEEDKDDGNSFENAGKGLAVHSNEISSQLVGDFMHTSAGIWNGVVGRATNHVNRAHRSSKTHQERKFLPIGEHTILNRSSSSRFASNPWSRKTFFNSYRSALLKVQPPPSITGEPSEPSSKLALNVTTPSPEIKSVQLMAMDSGSFICVKGNHLLFLREPVEMSGLEPWITRTQTDSELYIVEPPHTVAKRKGNGMENALKFIVLKTAFGDASHLVLENNVSDGPPTGVRRLLSKIVQIFVALATPPMCTTQRTYLLQELDSIVQCVPHLENETLSRILNDIAHGSGTKDLKENIIEINKMVLEVIEFLTRSYKIEYEDNLPAILGYALGGLLLLGGLVMLPISGIFYAVSGVATMFTSGCVATGGGVASATMAVFLSKNELMIPEYLAMLEIAIQEAKLWHDEDQASELPDKTEVALESLLFQEVERSGNHLTDMMKSIHNHGAEAQGIVFLSPTFQGATVESKGNLVRRMQIVAKTIHIYNTVVKDIRLVGIVGAEDTGKSTFIKKAIEHCGGTPNSEVLKIGIDCHTSTVRAYKLGSNEKLYLVDFPGSNGTGAYADAWKQFTSLPSSCVLLLDFKDDIKKDQVEMYQNFKKDLDIKVIVVFNKVDEKFTRRRESAYTAEYFLRQKENSAQQLGCESKDVHFACLDPDPEDRLAKLRKVGVLGFEELVQIVLSPRE